MEEFLPSEFSLIPENWVSKRLNAGFSGKLPLPGFRYCRVRVEVPSIDYPLNELTDFPLDFRRWNLIVLLFLRSGSWTTLIMFGNFMNSCEYPPIDPCSSSISLFRPLSLEGVRSLCFFLRKFFAEAVKPSETSESRR